MERRPLKILMVVGAYTDEKQPSKQPFITHQINSLIDAGQIIDIFNIKGDENSLNYFTKIPNLHKQIKKKQYDLIHAHYSYCTLIARFQLNCPVVVSFMGQDLFGDIITNGKRTIRSYIDRTFSLIMSRLLDGIIVKSQEMKESIGLSDIWVIPNGVDFNLFSPKPREEIRKELGLDSNIKYILFPASQKDPRKCYTIAEQSVNLLKQEGMQVELKVARNLSQSIYAKHISASDIVLLTSYQEGSPNVIKEAMACNIPIVSTDVGDVREVIGKTEGCYITIRTPEAVAKNLKNALAFGKHTTGRKDIDHLRLEKVAQRVIDFYWWVLARKGKINE